MSENEVGADDFESLLDGGEVGAASPWSRAR
jgi:hypothetical protein